MPLLEIEHLGVEFAGLPRVCAVDDVSFTLGEGETLCLVGESGCGKTVTAMSVARLLPKPPAVTTRGRVLLRGKDVFGMSTKELRDIRGGLVSYVFQEPAASLHPVMRVGAQIKESLRLHRPGSATDAEVIRLLKLVRIPNPAQRLRDYPFQYSGGMQQRVMLAIALASHPKLLIADEPTTALDVTIQAQILQLLRDLKAQLGMSLLLITHNLGIVAQMGGRLAVMYSGQLVETGDARVVLRNPAHPYTRALLESVPQLGARKERLRGIPGTVARRSTAAPGCAFAARCPVVRPECHQQSPALAPVIPGHLVRCPYAASGRAEVL